MFKHRSDKEELLDDENVPFSDVARNLRELEVINRWLGGYAVSVGAFRYVLQKSRPEVIVDIGSGGGDLLRHLDKWSRKSGYPVTLYGIDRKAECVSYAQTLSADHIQFVCDDYRNVFDRIPDATILHASLFCHHLHNEHISQLISFSRARGATLIINDLERHPLAYYSIRFLTRIVPSSHLVRNDAPLSVLRGFRKKEWKELLSAAGADNYRFRWRWAFRHQIIIYP
jgi:hypothetical protein